MRHGGIERLKETRKNRKTKRNKEKSRNKKKHGKIERKSVFLCVHERDGARKWERASPKEVILI